jgi:alkylation response protein AidB-like acyl-CoA dehydrogenase
VTSSDVTAVTPPAFDVEFISRVQGYADAALRPAALRTDRDGVSRADIARLGELGLLNHTAPVEFGGAGLGRAADRRIHELIAGACFNTWLVWAQHAPMVGRLALAHAQGHQLSALAREVLTGRLLLGAGISDVRRYPHSSIAATPTADGWRFSGTISWVSGWGLNSHLVVAAVDVATETVITAFVPTSGALRVHHLELAAVGGSRTERVTLDDVDVPASAVISTQSLHAWRTEDLSTTGDTRPHYFGLAATVLSELDDAAPAGARRVAQIWRPRIEELRASAYGLADEATAAGDVRHRLPERIATKAAVCEALATVTRALVVARSGRGISRDDTAQLHARSALFLLVQGQSESVRDAQLASLAG